MFLSLRTSIFSLGLAGIHSTEFIIGILISISSIIFLKLLSSIINRLIFVEIFIESLSSSVLSADNRIPIKDLLPYFFSFVEEMNK